MNSIQTSAIVMITDYSLFITKAQNTVCTYMLL